MAYEFTKQSCETFIEVLASKEAVPGGGGASALVGAIGAALGNMVANLTLPNPRYESVAEELKQVLLEMTSLQEQLIACVEEDAVGFEPLSKAYGLPRITEEEKELRAKIMEEALVKACEAPVRMVELCVRVIELLGVLAQKGAKLVISDAGVGVVLAKAAMQGAVLNVYVNTKMMKNRDYAKNLDHHCETLIEKASKQADEIYASVLTRIR